MRVKIKIAAIILLAALMIWGITRKEPKQVYQNAANLCFSCIGIE